MKPAIPLLVVLSTAACAPPMAMFASRGDDVKLIEGPPISDVRTGFDDALGCLRGKIPKGVVFAVGQVTDATGKENFSDGGAGKYVTQGAGEIVQSALFRAGVSVVNRRDSSITINEANWGIRDIKRQVPVNFYISGSINSLDCIPGGGGIATVAGIGPRYRQNRILIALDLSLTDAFTGRVVASVPLQKQIFASELGVGVNNFFGSTLVQLDAGGMHREAMHFALRQMLHLATFELIGQIMEPEVYASCRAQISEGVGVVSHSGTADPEALTQAIRGADDAPALAIPVAEPDAPPPAPEAATAPAAASAPTDAGAAPAAPAAASLGEQLGQKATEAATMAIKAARDSEAAADRKTAIQKASESLQLANLALIALKKAAEAGFGGDSGEVAAVVVQQALKAAQDAGTKAAQRKADPIPDAVGTPDPVPKSDPSAKSGAGTPQAETAEP
ncbi:MAG TPA: CsgG/HfaB family protein [Tabrizicola sp.]